MYIWRVAQEWRFENIVSTYQEKFTGADEPPPLTWQSFVSEVVRKAGQFGPSTVGRVYRVYPPLIAHQPAQGEGAASAPIVDVNMAMASIGLASSRRVLTIVYSGPGLRCCGVNRKQSQHTGAVAVPSSGLERF